MICDMEELHTTCDEHDGTLTSVSTTRPSFSFTCCCWSRQSAPHVRHSRLLVAVGHVSQHHTSVILVYLLLLVTSVSTTRPSFSFTCCCWSRQSAPHVRHSRLLVAVGHVSQHNTSVILVYLLLLVTSFSTTRPSFSFTCCCWSRQSAPHVRHSRLLVVVLVLVKRFCRQ